MKKMALLLIVSILAVFLAAAIPASSIPQASGTGPSINGVSACYVWIRGKPVKCSDLKLNQGEPRMEKVATFTYVSIGHGAPMWACAHLNGGVLSVGCSTTFYKIGVFRLPYGCHFRYQY